MAPRDNIAFSVGDAVESFKADGVTTVDGIGVIDDELELCALACFVQNYDILRIFTTLVRSPIPLSSFFSRTLFSARRCQLSFSIAFASTNIVRRDIIIIYRLCSLMSANTQVKYSIALCFLQNCAI